MIDTIKYYYTLMKKEQFSNFIKGYCGLRGLDYDTHFYADEFAAFDALDGEECADDYYVIGLKFFKSDMREITEDRKTVVCGRRWENFNQLMFDPTEPLKILEASSLG
jgi:hypothetical protein